jgi:hypothetical protein
MIEHAGHSIDEQRRLVQRIVAGGIPGGRELDDCRDVLRSNRDDEMVFAALFTLLQGALSDPFFGIEDSVQLVPILKAMAKGELTARELL